MRSVLQIVSAVAAPTTIVAALAFYIGTVRQEMLYWHFGLGAGVVGLTPQDHMLRSTDALVPFLIGLCVMLLVLVAAWATVGVWLHRHPVARAGVGWAAIGVGAGGVAVGVWRLVQPVALEGAYLLGPISLGLGAVILTVGARLVIRHGPVPVRQLPSAMWTAVTTATVVLLLLALFWAANDYARVQGTKRAEHIEAALGQLPAVVVHSDRPLHLSTPGVDEEALATAQGEYLYRYHGLRLLIRSEGRYFLLPSSWSRSSGGVVVLTDDERIRLEFLPGGRP